MEHGNKGQWTRYIWMRMMERWRKVIIKMLRYDIMENWTRNKKKGNMTRQGKVRWGKMRQGRIIERRSMEHHICETMEQWKVQVEMEVEGRWHVEMWKCEALYKKQETRNKRQGIRNKARQDNIKWNEEERDKINVSK